MNKAKLHDEIMSMPIIDSHEHLYNEDHYEVENNDVLKEYTSHYYQEDLILAGASPDAISAMQDASRPLAERWGVIEPYWRNARHTGYGQALDLAAKGLYGIECIKSETIEELNERFLALRRTGKHVEHVLKKSGIEAVVNQCKGPHFHFVFYVNSLIFPETYGVHEVSMDSGIETHSFDDWLEAANILIAKAFESGACGMKHLLAYSRPLLYNRATKAEAEAEFNQMYSVYHYRRPADEHDAMLRASTKFQDYMMHFILRIAAKKNIPFQIHTGLLANGRNYIQNANPEMLTPLFLQYPEVRFDVFHIGYPYQSVLGAIAKMFTNVTIDICWTNSISPAASIASLREWLEMLPINKIIAFGGDSTFPDAVYGCQVQARHNVAAAIGDAVGKGLFDEEEGVRIARHLLHDNCKALFSL